MNTSQCCSHSAVFFISTTVGKSLQYTTHSDSHVCQNPLTSLNHFISWSCSWSEQYSHTEEYLSLSSLSSSLALLGHCMQSTRSHRHRIIIYQRKCTISCWWQSPIFRHTLPQYHHHCIMLAVLWKIQQHALLMLIHDLVVMKVNYCCSVLTFLIICKTGCSHSSMPLPDWFSQRCV